jgi:alpha-L-fucosidase 2
VARCDPVLQRQVCVAQWTLSCAAMNEVDALGGRDSPAITLQGPFMEETRLPPWSNDYHFNVNAQLVYGPFVRCADAARRRRMWQPLWSMLASWMPMLQARGEAFFGAQTGAVLLPHAVDERGRTVDAYWTGTIDYGCAPWMAILAHDYAVAANDAHVLSDVVWPLMQGSFCAYWEASRREWQGSTLMSMVLPASVSPELGGASVDAIGSNASFQLALCHRILDLLPSVAARTGQQPDLRWDQARKALPRYAQVGCPAPVLCDTRPGNVCTSVPKPAEGKAEVGVGIGVWDGRKLKESHRHHSHLAGVFPFLTMGDERDDAMAIDAAMREWVRLGAGLWSGWAVTWAAALCARRKWAQGAVAWLHWYAASFTNEAGAGNHDGARGTSLFCVSSADAAEDRRRRLSEQERVSETMQLDGLGGLLTAMYEVCVQEDRRGVIHVVPAVPLQWSEWQFRRLECRGGVLVSARVERRELSVVSVEWTREVSGRELLQLQLPWLRVSWVRIKQGTVVDRGNTDSSSAGKLVVGGGCPLERLLCRAYIGGD